MSSRNGIGAGLVLALLLSACVSTHARKPSESYRGTYVLKADSMVFGCWITTLSTWSNKERQERCLGAGAHQPAPGEQVIYPKGTEVRILRIIEQRAPGVITEMAVVSVGTGTKSVQAYADWPYVLRLLEPVSNR